MKLSDLLKKYREVRGIQQKQLASMVGLDPTYLSKIENGKRSPPDRETILEIARAINLNESETDELLDAASHQRQTLFDLGFDINDMSLKKHISVLKEIKQKAPLTSYIRAKEEIIDHINLLRLKYTREIDEDVSKNTLLADYVYAKVRRGGLKALYQEVNRPLGGAVIIRGQKILLHQIGIGPLKGVWVIPAGYVNPAKGDKTAKDIAIRMVKRCLGDINVEVVRELTAEGEELADLDTSEHSLKLGLFPTVAQIYEVKVKSKADLKTSLDSGFFSFNDILKIKGDLHPLLTQILKPYVDDARFLKNLYLRGEQMIEKVVHQKNYFEELERFDRDRRRRVQ